MSKYGADLPEMPIETIRENLQTMATFKLLRLLKSLEIKYVPHVGIKLGYHYELWVKP